MHHFNGTNGFEPDGQLLELSDGKLYGTANSFFGPGTPLFRINKDGSGYEVLKFFSSTNGEPSGFLSGVTLGPDGALYGSLVTGIIKIQPDGTGLEVLHRWTNPPLGDGYIGHGVTVGNDGALYGVTASGGAYGHGTVFRIDTDGSDYSLLHHFRHVGMGVALPGARLVPGASGAFFGSSEGGGVTNVGTIFSLRANGKDGEVLHSFGVGTNAAKLPNALCDGGDGYLYGTTQQGGASNAGTIFRIGLNGSNYNVIRHLGAAGEPRGPRSGLLKGADGWLYGTSAAGGTGRGAIYKMNRETGDLVVLRGVAAADGQQPQCELVQDSEGKLYGTASIGGAQNFGTVFSINADGEDYAVLHSFTGGAEGQNPLSGVIIGSDGRLYGTTSRQFGAFAGCIYALNTDGTGFQPLKSFASSGADPKLPRQPLMEGPDGFLYGTAQLGGSANKGVLFRISKNGESFSVLHEFGVNVGDGQSPSAALTPIGDGSFLGLTEAGGEGSGTMFRFDPTEVRLGIRLYPTTVELRWASSSTVDAIEHAGSTFEWQPVAVPVSLTAPENQAIVVRQTDPQFFRVRRSWP